MPLTGINHIALATGSMDRTIRFWRDLLGLRLVVRMGEPGRRSYGFQLPDGDLVVFFEWDGVEPMPRKEHHMPVRGPFIFDHISFAVDCRSELSVLKERLKAAGYETSDVQDNEFFESIYSFDPNGIPIEFSTSVPRDMEPVLRDSSPSKVALEGTNAIADLGPSSNLR